MLETLKKNKTLKYLNLSHNNLVPQGQTDPRNYGNIGTLLAPIDEEGNIPLNPNTVSPSHLSPINQQAVENLSKFIRRNRQLIHLNLESTGLTYEMIKFLLRAVNRSKSLQAIHLCGNPGINEIKLIHDTVELLNPINFSQWDDIAVVGQVAKQSKSRKIMSSALTNRVLSRSNLHAR
jgi:hypothetical protein